VSVEKSAECHDDSRPSWARAEEGPRAADDERLEPSEVARRLSALPERGMRKSVLRTILERSPAESGAWLLDALATAGRGGGPSFDVSLLAAVDLTEGDGMPAETRKAIFAAAERYGLEACKELLSGEVGDPRGRETAPIRAAEGRAITLGERKSLARSWRRDVLERLLVDPHVDVVTLLLGNSRTTEEDILRIATSRRSSAAILGAILHSSRWAVRPRIRRALVRNPRLPTASALRLVGLLSRVELVEIAADTRLQPPVRQALHRRLRPKA
jgi:hypothetical protein